MVALINRINTTLMKTAIAIALSLLFSAQVHFISAQTDKKTTPTKIEKLAPTNELALLKISLSDMENNPRPYESIAISAAKGAKVYEINTDAEGKFEILLPKGDNYSVKVAGWGSTGESFADFELEAVEGLMDANLRLKYEPANSFTLENVLFETGKSNLKPASFAVLDEVAKYLVRRKHINAEIAGHTDNEGEDAANQTLSENRAKAVVDYLYKKGVAKGRLIPKGYGETQPVADNDSPEGRQLNRRTELLILEETK